MSQTRIKTPLFVISVLAALLNPTALLGQSDTQRVQIHGFGGWSLGNSDPYEYLSGHGEGENSYDNAEFALNLSAALSDKLRVAVQVQWTVEGHDQEVNLDFTMAEWSFSDSRATAASMGRCRSR